MRRTGAGRSGQQSVAAGVLGSLTNTSDSGERAGESSFANELNVAAERMHVESAIQPMPASVIARRRHGNGRKLVGRLSKSC